MYMLRITLLLLYCRKASHYSGHISLAYQIYILNHFSNRKLAKNIKSNIIIFKN